MQGKELKIHNENAYETLIFQVLNYLGVGWIFIYHLSLIQFFIKKGKKFYAYF